MRLLGGVNWWAPQFLSRNRADKARSEPGRETRDLETAR
jgi:hypothetical protein